MGNSKVIDLLVDSDFQIGGEDSEAYIVTTIDELNNNNNYEAYVDAFFLANPELDEDKTPITVKAKMVELLLSYKLTIVSYKPEYDEFFALAYTEALKIAQGGEDPIDALRNNGNVSEWDFTFDNDTSETNNFIIKENIKAAGALFNLYLLGDQLHLFALTDAVILKWWNGIIDVPKGEINNKMYRFYKLRSERNTADDRGMIYKRIFNMGMGKEMKGVMINDDFEMLWSNLMNEVIKYIDKREGKMSNEEVISKQPIFRAIREIQYNLSSSMNGMAATSTREIYANYLECKFILGHKEIINQVTRGKARNLNEVIRSLSAELFQEVPNVSAYFNTASTVQEIFNFIANFNGIAIGSDRFEDFVSLIDDYILNMELVNKKKNFNSHPANEIGEHTEISSKKIVDEFDEF
jgi:uncharacterized protein YeeX (DUF496 family)